MRHRFVALFLVCCGLFCATSTHAQAADDSHPLGRWNVAVFGGGGTGLFDRTDVQFFRAGGRIGRVLTRQRRLGSFEVDAEATPVDYVHWSGYKDVYGFGFNPLILKWDLPTHASNKLAPFFLAQGGMLLTSDNVPPGDTSKINFVTGVGVGMHVFTRHDRAVTFDVRATHLSNASLGNHNPGVNESLQFSVGYTWFKH